MLRFLLPGRDYTSSGRSVTFCWLGMELGAIRIQDCMVIMAS